MKKIIKNLTILFLTVAMIATFISCTGNSNTDSSTSSQNEAAQTVYPYKFTDSKGNEVYYYK